MFRKGFVLGKKQNHCKVFQRRNSESICTLQFQGEYVKQNQTAQLPNPFTRNMFEKSLFLGFVIVLWICWLLFLFLVVLGMCCLLFPFLCLSVLASVSLFVVLGLCWLLFSVSINFECVCHFFLFQD